MNDEFLIDDIFIDDIENFQNQRATPEGDKAASAFRQPPEGSEPASLLPSTLLPTKEDHISNQQVVTSQGYHPSTVAATSLPKDTTNPWDPRLLLDLALAVDPLEDILTRYSLTTQHYDSLMASRTFRRDLALMVRDVQENGASFKSKARVQAESYLPIIDMLVYDDNVAASTKLSAIQSIVRWGDLEPKPSKEEQTTNATTVNVQINF